MFKPGQMLTYKTDTDTCVVEYIGTLAEDPEHCVVNRHGKLDICNVEDFVESNVKQKLAELVRQASYAESFVEASEFLKDIEELVGQLPD